MLDPGDEPGLGICSRVTVVETIDIGQNHQQIGLGQVSHQSRKIVVVTETDFVHHHRVVLVDDRNDAEVEQRHEGIAGVEKTPPVGQIVPGQQNLRDSPITDTKSVFVKAHQPALADSRCCLLEGNGRRPADNAKIALTGSYRTGRNQQHLVALLDQLAEIGDQRMDNGRINTIGTDQHTTADLDDDPFNFCQKFFAHARSLFANRHNCL